MKIYPAFRAWDKEYSDWVIIKSIGLYENGEIWYVERWDECENVIDPPLFMDDDTWELTQATNISDINNVRVFVKDFVELDLNWKGGRKGKEIFEVNLDESGTIYIESWDLCRIQEALKTGEIKSIRVIGNAFENTMDSFGQKKHKEDEFFVWPFSPRVKQEMFYKEYIHKLKTPLSEEAKVAIGKELRNIYDPNNTNLWLGYEGHLMISKSERDLILQEFFTMGLIAPKLRVEIDCDCDCECTLMYNSNYFADVGNIIYGQSIYEFLGIPECADEELKMKIEMNGYRCHACETEYDVYADGGLDRFKEAYKMKNIDGFSLLKEPDISAIDS